MSDTDNDVKICLKVMVDKEKTKVLFAEADSDTADVLLSFLTLPLGRIAKLLEKQYGDKAPVFGSITSLYKGFANLDIVHFSTSAAKQMVLDPRSSLDSIICRNLKLDITNSEPIKYFGCNRWSCKHKHDTLSLYYENTRIYCPCGKMLNDQVFIKSAKDAGVLFTSKKASFIFCDDLRMMPYTTGFISTLTNLGITGADGAELRNLTIGSDEIMDLLKCCLFSKTPLSDFVLKKGEIISSDAKPEHGLFFDHQIEKEESSNSKNIILKVMVQKSTGKVLFAQAEYDFIELLCSILVIPIGGLESLLKTHTCLKSFYNLHKSISDFIDDKCFTTANHHKKLMNPDIPLFYISKNTLLPLDEESAHAINNGFTNNLASIISPKGEHYVKESITYMVTDDLTVMPFCMSSGFSFLNRLNISISDVHELEVRIGLEEGLSILKASISSNSALTNGLLNRTMKRQLN